MISGGYRKLAIATCVGMLIVLLGGALVTNTGSGDGCGTDWPLCNGALVPELEGATLIAFIHRVAAALFLALAIALHVFIRRWRTDGETAKLSSWVLGLTLGQVLSGALVAWTVGNEDLFIFTSLLHNLVICGLFSLLADLTIQSCLHRAGGGRTGPRA